jgi:hypothetical protein
MGRSHDFFCTVCQCYFSPLAGEDSCPCGAPEELSFYDINFEATELAPDGRPWWQHWLEERDRDQEELMAAIPVLHAQELADHAREPEVAARLERVHRRVAERREDGPGAT